MVLTTTARAADARRIARALVDRGLAACVQTVGPLRSRYRWQGRVETAREWLSIIKTDRRRSRQVAAEVRRIHPYDTPEIACLPLTPGSARYRQWLDSSLAPVRPGPRPKRR